tara:strand:- start:441 stop:869 length:429 start_codon:yes stop_codon:yes gene_type:complete
MNNYNRLKEIQKQYPKLTFDNDGYQYIRKELEEHKEQVEEINSILSKEILGFSKFFNFKPRKDGSFAVRCDYNWGAGDEKVTYFIGVGYFEIEEFKEKSIHASSVLQLMDEDYSYAEALEMTLINNGSITKKELEAELTKYI